ncbi:MAG: sucrase ferredoxin [Cyanobacteria bacterium J06621_11]
MKPSFCAIANRQSGEDLIGTASHYQTYVLIECPLPWAAKAFTSKHIPAALRQYVKAIKAERSVQFLTVSRARPSQSVTLMVYERTIPSENIAAGGSSLKSQTVQDYRGYEFQLENLEQVVDCLEAHWQGHLIGKPITCKDILICTHGMRDKCCARFGQPLFREAMHSIQQGNLPNTRVWKVSHIGGHRFAPTAISLPDGRYYGRLTIEALQSIVTRSGPVSQLESMYRGWGLLPTPLQALERMLLLRHGWDWLACSVSYRILSDSKRSDKQSDSQQFDSQQSDTEQQACHQLSVELSINLPESESATVYQATLFQDPDKTLCLKASCSSAIAAPIIKYTVAECIVMTPELRVRSQATGSLGGSSVSAVRNV